MTRRTALGTDLRKRCSAHRSALPDYGSESWGFDSLPARFSDQLSPGRSTIVSTTTASNRYVVEVIRVPASVPVPRELTATRILSDLVSSVGVILEPHGALAQDVTGPSVEDDLFADAVSGMPDGDPTPTEVIPEPARSSPCLGSRSSPHRTPNAVRVTCS